MGQIVILSGPVGAGKSTVARELIAASGEGTAYIEGDTFWSFIAKPATGQSYPKAFTMIMRAMTATARHYERDGYEVLLDFSIPPWYLEAIGKLLQGKSFSYVVLRPSEEVCAARARPRAPRVRSPTTSRTRNCTGPSTEWSAIRSPTMRRRPRRWPHA